MSEVKVKICGLTTIEDVATVAQAGVDMVGLNFYPQSPRFIKPQAAIPLMKALPPWVSPIGLFIGQPMRQVCAVAYQLGLRGVQTYSENYAEGDASPFAHIPAFRVKNEQDLTNLQVYCKLSLDNNSPPSAILIDAHVDGLMGGTGKTAPWDLLAGLNCGFPLILAGGLTPENVAEAIRVVKPHAVDVASGVESSPGRKDPAKVRDFMAAVRA